GGRHYYESARQQQPSQGCFRPSTCVGKWRGRGLVDPDDPRQRSPDAIGFRGRTLPFPSRQVDRLELAKTERRIGSVQRKGDQLARVAAISRFVAYPGGFDRVRRPQNQNSVTILEGVLDLRREGRSTFDVVLVAPDFVAFALQPHCHASR